MHGPVVEDGVIAGNFENKYAATGVIKRRLMNGFLDAGTGLAVEAQCRDVLEVGCGEGQLSIHLARKLGLPIRATDFSQQILAQAEENARAANANAQVSFGVLDLNTVEASVALAELVVCCEVLEHVPDPGRVLRQLNRLASKRLLLSVPREPIWRLLNMARGKYLADFGNTPGHLQHWSTRAFLDFVGSELDILAVRTPLPWTVVLAKPRVGVSS
jgi:2-polyprenyl-3-methyl-5-hydroxy-6-metoxy-1,4-benzoquinol methylase